LAHGLPDPLRKSVAEAYGELSLASSLIVQQQQTGHGARSLASIQQQLQKVGADLLDYLRAVLGAEL
jgi:hypothetical protein